MISMAKKVLLYEYVTGGGLINEALKSNLYKEAKLMITTLIKDSENNENINSSFFCDNRLSISSVSNSIKINKKNYKKIYNKKILDKFDYIIPILPESNNNLYNYVKFLNDNNIKNLISSPRAIMNTSDKWLFYKKCLNSQIKTIPTYLDKCDLRSNIIIKDRYGEGCSSIKLYKTKRSIIENIENQNKIMQPYIEGIDLSLSVFFDREKFHILSVNKQNLSINKDNLIKLKSILVNITVSFEEKIYALVNKIHKSFFGLYGYIGIDIIVDDKNIFVVEINPRLTTSFVGIKYTKGINLLDLISKKNPYKNIISGKKYLINL